MLAPVIQDAKEAAVPYDDARRDEPTPIDATLLEILVCPIDHGALRIEASNLVCTVCGRSYPVEDGIPNMLIDPA